MKYLAVLVTSFLAIFSVWFVLWYLSLGGYQKAEHWLRYAYQIKAYSANKITEEKIIIASGSNGLFGISSEVIAQETGYSVINMAGHAGLTFNFLADQIEQVASSGDIVIMPLEFGFYSREDELTDWQLSNMQSWGADHLRTFGVRELFRYFKSTNFSSYIERSFGAEAVEYLDAETIASYCSGVSSKEPGWQGYTYKSMNCYGDILVDRDTMQSILDLRDRGSRSYLVSSDVSDEFFVDARRLSERLNNMGAKLYFTWPATIKNKNFDLHEAGSYFQSVLSLRKNLVDGRLNVICDPVDFNVDAEYFFNTDYHLNKKGAVLRSVKLSDCINDEVLGVVLSGQDVDTAVKQYLSSESDVALLRISHLRELNEALRKYKLKFGNYPKSHLWDGLYTNWGHSKADWIDGLAPDFIDTLPRDPRNNAIGSQQYLYRSNGIDFKLLAHGVRDDCPVIKLKYPELIDPIRNCNAYGFWSEGAEKW
jgi:hypothetical protein